ncbi:MAG: PAS domain-containing protein, partial [Myxococcaceae bacterium]|nr:PAS domain-containing protein [Myxococcaceae bacterium]
MAALLDDVLQASIDGVCVFDRDHRCTHWSPALAELTGIEPRDAL